MLTMKRLPTPVRCNFPAGHPKRVDIRLFIVTANHNENE
jgi:hypothetical protein